MRLGLVAVIGAAALAGCGGGGSNGGETEFVVAPSIDGPDATFGQIRGDFAQKFVLYDDPFPPTSLTEMPIFGSASYTGSAVYSDQTADPVAVRANPTRVSRVEMTADFVAADVNGRLYNFRDANPSTVVSGELALTGIIDGNTFRGGAFNAPGGVSGTLVTNGAAATHDGAFIGNFAGSNAEAINGVVVHGTSTSTYSGVFVADR
jgi:hypothetical protein